MWNHYQGWPCGHWFRYMWKCRDRRMTDSQQYPELMDAVPNAMINDPFWYPAEGAD